MLVAQLAISLVAAPLVSWLFREAIRANGGTGLDLAGLQFGSGFPLTVGLLIVLALLAFWLLSMEFSAIVVTLDRPRQPAREFASHLKAVSKRLFRPSSLVLLAYLFLLLPLTGFGFASLLTQGIAIPPFITGELAKEPAMNAALAVIGLAFAWLNLRLSLTVPSFVLRNVSGAQALRESWRLTRGLRTQWNLVVTVFGIIALSGLAWLATFFVALLPTLLTDALAPAASPVVAAFSLGAAQVVGLIVTGLATATIAGALITLQVKRAPSREPGHFEVADRPAATSPSRSRAAPRLTFAASLLLLAVLFGAADLGTMNKLATQPETLVIGHRGDPNGGVENTVSSLDAAKESGADLVEMDVLQTKDEQFVVMHDANLQRLAGTNANVKDLTLDELTKLTVRDLDGHEDTIPSLETYMLHAEKIGMPILLEIKLGGLDTPDHVDQLVSELERLGVLTSNIYHSLDPESVARLKQLRPDLTVGYTMAVAGGGVPDTPADFITVEQWSASDEFQQDVEDSGRGFMVWTVDEDEGMREYFRRNVAGIITDNPAEAIDVRTEIDETPGFADVLADALSRFVVAV